MNGKLVYRISPDKPLKLKGLILPQKPHSELPQNFLEVGLGISLTLYLDSKVVVKKMWAIPELKSELSVAVTRRGPYLKLLIKPKLRNFSLKSVRLL